MKKPHASQNFGLSKLKQARAFVRDAEDMGISTHYQPR